jgi:hypothetical protein
MLRLLGTPDYTGGDSMSAFIVDRKHIRYLVEAASRFPSHRIQGGRLVWYDGEVRHDLKLGDHEGQERMGQVLWTENIRSVSYRYQDDTLNTLPGPIGESYVYGKHHSFPFVDVKAVQTLKACDCYEYQSCEHPEWETSEAKSIIDAIRKVAIHALPGYEDAKWEI